MGISGQDLRLLSDHTDTQSRADLHWGTTSANKVRPYRDSDSGHFTKFIFINEL